MAGAKEVRYPPFHWWQGIVEDRNDPAYMGRYRVRIFGYHTANKEQLPTENLPWSVPMQPVTSAAISGWVILQLDWLKVRQLLDFL